MENCVCGANTHPCGRHTIFQFALAAFSLNCINGPARGAGIDPLLRRTSFTLHHFSFTNLNSGNALADMDV